MHKYEYWAHRLVPHMAFDDFIERAENFGGKRPVKVGQSSLLSDADISHVLLKDALQNLRDQPTSRSLPNDEGERASHTLVSLKTSEKP